MTIYFVCAQKKKIPKSLGFGAIQSSQVFTCVRRESVGENVTLNPCMQKHGQASLLGVFVHPLVHP